MTVPSEDTDALHWPLEQRRAGQAAPAQRHLHACCPPPGPDNGCCPHLLIFLPGTLFLLLMLYNFWFFLILQCLKALDQLSCRIFLDVGLSVPMLIRFG